MKLLKFKGAAFLRLRHEPNQAKPNWHADLNGQRVVIDFISTFINLQKTSDYVLRITVASIWIGGKWLRWRPMPFMACLDELWSERTMATWMRRMLSRLFFVWSWWWSVYGVLSPFPGTRKFLRLFVIWWPCLCFKPNQKILNTKKVVSIVS